MKRKIRYLTSLLVLTALVLFTGGMAVRAQDEGTCSITIDDTGTYVAYQIFTGTYDSTSNTLSDIGFGSGINEDTFKEMSQFKTEAAKAILAKDVNVNGDGEAVKYADIVASLSEDDLRAFADEMVQGVKSDDTTSSVLKDIAGTSAVTDGKAVISGLSAGYYLVKNQDGTAPAMVAALEVVGSAKIEPKISTIPTISKKVLDMGNSTDTYADSADLGHTDTISFQLTASIPDGLSNYASTGYDYIIHELNDTDINTQNYTNLAVKAGDTTLTESEYTVSNISENDMNGIEIVIKNILNYKDKGSIVVTYDTTYSDSLTKEAGKDYLGKAYVEYTNDPYASTDSSSNTATSYIAAGNAKSTEDYAAVFSYTLQVTKVDENDKALTGADFEIKFGDNTITSVTGAEDDNNVFTFYGLRDGIDYTLTESQVPAGYNQAKDIEFTIDASGHVLADGSVTSTNVKAVDSGSTEIKEISYDSNQKLLSITITNKKGTVLPSTGGNGTLILVGGGAVLILGASLFLVTNKRIKKEGF